MTTRHQECSSEAVRLSPNCDTRAAGRIKASKMILMSFEDAFHDAEELGCPSCGGGYLHHDGVQVFDRGEDAPKGLHVRWEAGEARVCIDELRENPSSRRGAITIRFHCEGCPAKPKLAIVQHKGMTYVGWLEESVIPEGA